MYSGNQKSFCSPSQVLQYTINGCHLNDAGDREVARLIDDAMFDQPNPASFGSDLYERVRAAVNDKSWVHLQDYRMLNGWYVYGGRRTWDTETFPVSMQKSVEWQRCAIDTSGICHREIGPGRA